MNIDIECLNYKIKGLPVLKFDPYTWYKCYAWAGIVVFVKYSEKEE